MGKFVVEQHPNNPTLIFGANPEVTVLERIVEVEKRIEVPVEVIKEIEKIIYQDKEVIRYLPALVSDPQIITVTKEVPVEVIKEVIKEIHVEVFKDKFIEVMVEKEKLVTLIQHKVPVWVWSIVGAEALAIIILLLK